MFITYCSKAQVFWLPWEEDLARPGLNISCSLEGARGRKSDVSFSSNIYVYIRLFSLSSNTFVLPKAVHKVEVIGTFQKNKHDFLVLVKQYMSPNIHRLMYQSIFKTYDWENVILQLLTKHYNLMYVLFK